MAYLGREAAKAPIVTADLPDDGVTLAKMTGGTDGQIITYDASGDPVAVGPGTDGQVLTSTGAGSPPAFEAAAGGMSVSDITGATALGTQPALTDEFVLSDAGTLKRMDATYMMNVPYWRAKPSGNSSGDPNGEVVFGTEVFDSDSAFASNVFTVPAGKGGYYQINAIVTIAPASPHGDDFNTLFLASKTSGGGYANQESSTNVTPGTGSNAGQYVSSQISTVLYLEAGGAVHLVIGCPTDAIIIAVDTSFSGFKLITQPA